MGISYCSLEVASDGSRPAAMMSDVLHQTSVLLVSIRT